MANIIRKIDNIRFNAKEDQLSFVDKLFIFIYLFFSCFETYMPSFLASCTKIIMILIPVFFIFKDMFRKSIVIKWPSIIIIIWLTLKLVSIFWGGYNDIVSLHFFSQFGFVLLFITFASKDYSKKDISFFVNSLLITTCLFSLMSIVFQAPYHTIYVSRRVLTLFGKQLDPNNCAAFHCICIAISLYYFSIKRKYFYCLPALVASIACFLSGSRAGLIALIALYIVAILVYRINTRFSLLFKICFIALIGAIALLLAYYFLPTETFKRLFIVDYAESGGGERNIYWNLAKDMFLQKPVFGWGWGTASFFGKTQSFAVHNTYLSMLAENGLLGLSLFMIFPIYSVFISIRKRDYFSIFIFIAMFIPSFFIDSINKRFIWNCIYLMLFLNKPYSEALKEFYEKKKIFRVGI